MAYVFSSVSDRALGCPECGGTCARRAPAASRRTLGEWYVREEPEDDGDDEDRTRRPAGRQPASGQRASLGAAPPLNAREVITGFEFDRTGLPHAERGKLVRLAQRILAGHRGPYRVIGHTDPSGTDAYNLDLGLRRAEEVQRQLIITLERLRPGSSRGVMVVPATAGERRPVAPNTSEQSRAHNRRVEILAGEAALMPVIPAYSRLPAIYDATLGVPWFRHARRAFERLVAWFGMSDSGERPTWAAGRFIRAIPESALARNPCLRFDRSPEMLDIARAGCGGAPVNSSSCRTSGTSGCRNQWI